MNGSLNKEIKREQILEEGIRLFMLHGYHGTGVKKILDAVNIPKGSFYSYFGSKEDFAAEAITVYIAPFIKRLNSQINNPENNGLEALQLYFLSLIKELEVSNFEGGCLLGDMMGEMSTANVVCRQALVSAINEYNGLTEAALLSAQNDKLVRTDLSAKLMADFLFNQWQGALLRMKLQQSAQPLHEFQSYFLSDYILCKNTV